MMSVVTKVRMLPLFLIICLLLSIASYILIMHREEHSKDYEKATLEYIKAGVHEQTSRFYQSYQYHATEPNRIFGSYSFFDKNTIYSSNSNVPSRQLTQDQDIWLQEVRQMAAQELSTTMGFYVPADHFNHGRYRWSSAGVEVDLSFRVPGTKTGLLRISLFRPFHQFKVTETISVPINTVVNIILASSGDINLLDKFFDHMTLNVLPHDSHVTVTVVIPTTVPKDNIETLVANKLLHFESVKVKVVQSSKTDPFSTKEEIYKKETHKKWDLLMLLDDEIFVMSEALMRCRSNAVKGHKIYVPIPFKLYDTQFLDSQKKDFLNYLEDSTIQSDYGEWDSNTSRAMCLYRSDLASIRDTIIHNVIPVINNITQDKKDLGNIKKNLPIVTMQLSEGPAGGKSGSMNSFMGVEQIISVASQLDAFQVQRIPDPGLYIHHIRRNCSVDLGQRAGRLDDSELDCLKNKAEALGSKYVLGLSLLKLTHGEYVADILENKSSTPKIIILLVVLLLISFFVTCVQANIMLKHANDNKRRRLQRNLSNAKTVINQ